MVRYKTVLLLIITVCSAPLVCPLSPTNIASEHHSDAPFPGLVESSNVLPELSAEFIYSTYLGGSNIESNIYTATNSNGDVWITGSTDSDNFPTTPDAYDTDHNGTWDVFVSKFELNPASSRSGYY